MLDFYRKYGLLWNRRGGHDISKKRLYAKSQKIEEKKVEVE